MRSRWLLIPAATLTALAAAGDARMAERPVLQPRGPFARIAVLRPHEGRTVDFEAGYIRHLDWHRQAGDPWVWYGWTIWAGERQRWFVYATFGHAAGGFDGAVAPAEDERDNVLNVVPHAEFAGNALYEFLPALSRGTGVPQPSPRVELATVDLRPGAEKVFEEAIASVRPRPDEEILWYRMLAGGSAPRYVRLRPRPNLEAVVEGSRGPLLPDAANAVITRATVEILTLRPTMSYGLGRPSAP